MTWQIIGVVRSLISVGVIAWLIVWVYRRIKELEARCDALEGHDEETQPMAPTQPLNPGIRRTVEWLNDNLFKTTDSGDGATHDFECDREYPYVTILTSKEGLITETDRLFHLLRMKGVMLEPVLEDSPSDAPSILASYDPSEPMLATIELYYVTDALLFPEVQS